MSEDEHTPEPPETPVGSYLIIRGYPASMVDTLRDDSELSGVVAIGGSAGGVEALTSLAAGLPAELPYAVLMALHLPKDAPSVLARIIDRAGPLPASSARSGERLEPGRIYVAVPDHHLLAEDHRTVLSRGPTENGHRPALNAMFRSVAVAWGPRAVGVLLSGVLDDGALGLAAVRAMGGRTICQSPGDAIFSAMPLNAIEAGVVDRQAPASDIGALLEELSSEPVKDSVMQPDPKMRLENHIAMAPPFITDFNTTALGPPSGYTCPDCHGSLQQIDLQSYRCHVGHAWTASALLTARDREIDAALWVAMRSLQEKVRLARRLADKSDGSVGRRYTESADEAERAMTLLGERLNAINGE